MFSLLHGSLRKGFLLANPTTSTTGCHYASVGKKPSEYIKNYDAKIQMLTQRFQEMVEDLEKLNSFEPDKILHSKMDCHTMEVRGVSARELTREKESELDNLLASVALLEAKTNDLNIISRMYNNH